ncbi:protein kinase [Streptomyces sp. NPDC056817]|uniref:serine/threonine-protein kinase n=1 Tax=Streptomyces sp. NPDC056817 TaxID=3345950 RepID=UPI0036CBC999
MGMLDRYERRNPLGQGNMGEVWQSWDTQLKRQVAVKTIRPDLLTGTATAVGPSTQIIVARFRREAELGARFSHPGLPILYDAQLSGSPKDLYMVSELVLGQNLVELLTRQGGRLPIPQALAFAAQLADVLACTHADPVIHRDLKPANVMITEGQKVKLLDFGVAAVFGTDYPRLTQPGQLLGTIAYMAPEQFADRGILVPQTDTYALGCLLYEMLTGQPPFPGNHATAMAGHCYGTPTAVRELRPDLDTNMSDLVMSMLAKKPAARPSARYIADRLSAYVLSSSPTTQPTVGTVTAAPPIGSEPPVPQPPLHIRAVQAKGLFDAGRFGEALAAYNKLVAELAAAGDDTHQAAQFQAKAAFCHFRLGNQEVALQAYQTLAEELSHHKPAEEPLLLEARSRIGLLQAADHQTAAALTTLASTYTLLVEHLGPQAPLTVEVRDALNGINQLGGVLPRQDPPSFHRT